MYILSNANDKYEPITISYSIKYESEKVQKCEWIKLYILSRYLFQTPAVLLIHL